MNSFLVRDQFKVRNIALTPQIGYFVNDNLLIGTRIGYSQEKNVLRGSSGNIVINSEARKNIFRIGPYLRFHKSINDQLYLFTQGNIDLGFGKIKNENKSTDIIIEENVFEFEAGLKPGLLFLLSDRFGIESSFGFLGYKLIQTKLKDSDLDPIPINKDQDFGLDLNFKTFSLGFQIYL